MRVVRRAAVAGWIGVALAAKGCSPKSGAPPDASGTAAAAPDAERLICPTCRAGGETSDFGGEEPPTPCQLSEVPVVVDRATAKELGFGSAIEAIETEFEVPLAWTRSASGAAAGYSVSSRLLGAARVTLFEFRAPLLEGCRDHMRVEVDVGLRTADAALSVSGRMQGLLVPDRVRSSLHGSLDLSKARGTLELQLPVSRYPYQGSLDTQLYFSPDGVRAQLKVTLVELMPDAEVTFDDSVNPPGLDPRVHQPLEARAPADACPPWLWPLAVDDGRASPNGQDMLALHGWVRALFSSHEPVTGTWLNGSSTEVAVHFGQPFAVCANELEHTSPRFPDRLEYRVPLHISSADGRVDVGGDATAAIGLDADGHPSEGFMVVHRGEVILAHEFEATSGISGVMFGDNQIGATWYAETGFVDGGAGGPRGQVTVRSVYANGRFGLDLDSLTW